MQLMTNATVCEDSGQLFDDTTPIAQSRKSLDRIDNNKGYVHNNVRMITWQANDMPGKIPLNSWKAAAAAMRDHNAWYDILNP